MARQEQDREDLLREATALAERAELQLPDYVVEFPRFHGGGDATIPLPPGAEIMSAKKPNRTYTSDSSSKLT